MISHDDTWTEIAIGPFDPQDQEQVKQLVLAGLVEHWGVLDPSKNPDLNDIAAAYANATFLVARQQGQIVATGALVPRTRDCAQIVRMYVATAMRRRGIGRMMLAQLRAQACQQGYTRLVLETTETWDEAIAFYTQFGFRITHYQDGNVYFSLDLLKFV